MKKTRRLLILVFLCSLLAPVVNAQDQPVDERFKNIKEKDKDQMQDYLEGEYLFPPQPRNNWSIGIKGGLAYQSADVKPQPGFGFAVSARKALGHAFSLRFEAGLGQTIGLNYGASQGYANHNESPWNTLYFPGGVNAIDGGGAPPQVFYNYRMRYGDFSIQGLVNLNNINFYKEQNKWNIYAAGGIGFMGYTVDVNALDANGNPYDFSGIASAVADPNDAFSIGNNKRNTLDELRNLLDDSYETNAEGHGDEQGFKLGNSNYVVNPLLTGALGVRFRVNRRVELELEHRIAWSNDDLLDGQRWSEQGVGASVADSRTALTRDFDSYSTTTLGIHFRLGPGEESLWWNNPLTEVYSSAREAVNIVSRLTDDADDDGVPDLYDLEPDTPVGMIVDSQGRVQDSDGDGYPDSQDDQPYTPKGCDVDNKGVALDSDADGVPDCFDKEPDSAPGVLVDAKGITIPIINPDTLQFETPCILPVVYFELDKDVVAPQFYPQLNYIAQLMKSDSKLKIKATGFSDSRSSDDYNLQLSKRRVDNTVSFIANTFGIDPTRFEKDYKGEANAVIPNLPANKANPKLEPLHYVNRRVEFDCVK